MKLIVIISVIAILLIGLGRYVTIQEMKTENLSDPYQIYNLVNDYRASNGLKKLKWNPAMCKFTAVRLSQIHYDYSHHGFFSDTKDYYTYVNAAENLNKEFTDPEGHFSAWKNSPVHNKDMLNPLYTDTCVASDDQYAVQEFASF